MANIVHITAGLPVAKNSGQSPSAGVNTVFITAGMPAEVLSAPVAAAKKQAVIGGGILR